MDVIKAVKRITLLTFFLPFGLIAQQANSEYVYVLKDSISLSSLPSDRAEYTETYLHRNDKLKIIPNKQAVVWQNKAILSDQLENCENYFEVGQFVLVQKDSLMGYVFDKYLSEFNPSTIQQNQKYNTKSVVDSILVDEKTYYLNKESVQLTEAIRFESFEDEGCHNLSYIFNQKNKHFNHLIGRRTVVP